jgi:negative regulator of flagellin synthesis FlgM
MAIHHVKGDAALQDAASTATSHAAKSEKTTKAAAAGAYAKAAASPSVKDAANVQISPRAKEMSLARKIAEETPDVNEEKVAKYKELIAKGQYKPDAGKIADGIAKEALLDEYAHNRD